MALSNLDFMPTTLLPLHRSSSSSSRACACCCYVSREDGRNNLGGLGFHRIGGFPSAAVSISVSRVSTKRSLPRTLNAAQPRILDNAAPSTTRFLEIPVTCYQLVGARAQAEKDEIVKSVMQLKSAEVEEGYTMDAVISRQDLLMDVRDRLLFEPEYAGNVKDKIPPKSSLRIPWNWLPGALCLLQEVGEEKLVLGIGQAARQHLDAKPYVHDVLLAMALAECAIAMIGFEKNKVSHGFEALCRAQGLLKSETSLRNMPLLSQIEESLEELAPACTMELLAMPQSPEHADRRQRAIAALRELLRQGLHVETKCSVQDWPCFFSQALSRLLASEIVDLLPWDHLAFLRKNKKSLESQNQRIVIDCNCFYAALIAHIAHGFSSRQTDLINKAKVICEFLTASEGIDLKVEEAFCLFLLGQGNEPKAAEKLLQRELNSDPAAQSLVSGKGMKLEDVSVAKPSLETWLKDAVLDVFSDTRDCSSSLANFFSGTKRGPAGKKNMVAPLTKSAVSPRPLADIALQRMDVKSSQHLGSVVKQLVPSDLQSSLVLGKSGNGSNVEPSVQLKRNLGVHHSQTWGHWFPLENVVVKVIFTAALGCIVFIAVKLSPMNAGRVRIAPKLPATHSSVRSSSLASTRDSSLDYNVGATYIKGGGFARRVKELLTMLKMQLSNQTDAKTWKGSRLASGTPSIETTFRKKMPVEEAEALVKQWQAVKAEALGPNHQVQTLSEILDESMLSQWQGLADAAKDRSCYWRFVLLQLLVLEAGILSDGNGVEIAEIEAVLEEAAELVDRSLQKNPNYCSTYKIQYMLKRQDGGSWKFCEGDIQTPS